jgi:hypothetical protein
MAKTKYERQIESRAAQAAYARRLEESEAARENLRITYEQEAGAHLMALNHLGGNPLSPAEETLCEALVFLLERYAEEIDNG